MPANATGRIAGSRNTKKQTGGGRKWAAPMNDKRSQNGIAVTLFWLRGTDVLLVSVIDHRHGEGFELVLEPHERALDVFHHPYARTRPLGGSISAQTGAQASLSSSMLASSKSDALPCSKSDSPSSCASFVVPGSAAPTPAPAERVRPYRVPLDPGRRSADRKCQAPFRCQPPSRNTGQQQCAGPEHPAPWHACRSRRLRYWRSWSRSWRSGCCSSARRCACAAAVEAGTVRIVQTRRAGADGRESP
jgi:hypothetical protein